MRHLPTRTSRTIRRRIVGALATGLLCAAGVTAPAAVADPPESGASGSPGASAQDASPTLDDGLALTPPMGFNNWNSTHCRAEFNEAMVEGIADIFVDKGLKAAGYQYVNLDDCWALPQRDANGKLVPDPARFPHGIKAVADYVHSKGLKLGIYTSAGTKTCSDIGFPGGLGHEYSDAQQFADWGVDYLKYDNCNNQGVDAKQRYRTMRDALKATGRPIVYSLCEWGSNKPWEWAADVGHLWRTTGDISDSWGSMLSLMKQNLPLAQYAGPGHWNDPDMLEVGNGGMTATEYRTHFSMWSIMASPLLIGTDLRKASAETLDILSNRDVIAVDQDPLGKQGTVLSSEGGRWVVAKEMKDGSRVVALFNESGDAQRIATSADAVGLPRASAYTLRDLWQHKSYNTAGTISATVPAHGTVLVRVAADGKWAANPPAVELGLGGAPFVEAGKAVRLTTSVTDLGRTPARQVSVALSGPSGWSVRPASPTGAGSVPTGKALTTSWSVTAPHGDRDGSVRPVPQGHLPLAGRCARPERAAADRARGGRTTGRGVVTGRSAVAVHDERVRARRAQHQQRGERRGRRASDHHRRRRPPEGARRARGQRRRVLHGRLVRTRQRECGRRRREGHEGHRDVRDLGRRQEGGLHRHPHQRGRGRAAVGRRERGTGGTPRGDRRRRRRGLRPRGLGGRDAVLLARHP